MLTPLILLITDLLLLNKKLKKMPLAPGTRIGTNTIWTVRKLLGEGGFGAVYQVTDPQGRSFALKVEDVNAQNQLLQMEVSP